MNNRAVPNILLLGLLAVGHMQMSVAAGSAQPTGYRLVKMDALPHIDGRLDDESWSRSLRIEGFRSIRGQDDGVPPTTVAWMGYDQEALYLAVHCAEPRMDQLRTRIAVHDGPTWQDDCIELFLAPPGDMAGYAHVSINAAGVVRDAWRSVSGEEDLGWTSDAFVAARRQDDGWAVEARLPFDRLRLIGEGDWSFQLARTRPGARQHLTMLEANLASFHVPRYFAPLSGLKFASRPIRVLEATLGERLVGVNVGRVTLANESDEVQAFAVTVDLEGKDNPVGQLRGRLEPGARRTVELPWRVEVGWRGRVWLTVIGDERFAGGFDGPVEPPAVLADAGPRALMYRADDAVLLSVPVALAAGSRETARLDWRLLDTVGVEQAYGTLPVCGSTVDVPLRPQQSGRHELQLTLWWDGDGPANAAVPLYLVASPFVGRGDVLQEGGQ